MLLTALKHYFGSQVIEMGVAGQSKETVTFIVQNLNQALQDRAVRKAACDPHSMPPASLQPMLSQPIPPVGHNLSRVASGAVITTSDGGQYVQGVDAAAALSPGGRSPNYPGRGSRRYSLSERFGSSGGSRGLPDGYPLTEAADLGSSFSVLRRFAGLIFSQRAFTVYLLLICVLQLLLLFWINSASGRVVVTVGGGASQGSTGSTVEGTMGTERSYWLQRLSVLQQELELLNGRTEAVAKEVSAVIRILTAGSGGSSGQENSTCPSSS